MEVKYFCDVSSIMIIIIYIIIIIIIIILLLSLHQENNVYNMYLPLDRVHLSSCVASPRKLSGQTNFLTTHCKLSETWTKVFLSSCCILNFLEKQLSPAEFFITGAFLQGCESKSIYSSPLQCFPMDFEKL